MTWYAFAVGILDLLDKYKSNPEITWSSWGICKELWIMVTYRYSDHLDVIWYSNLDFGWYVDTRKCTSRYNFLISRYSVSKKQQANYNCFIHHKSWIYWLLSSYYTDIVVVKHHLVAKYSRFNYSTYILVAVFFFPGMIKVIVTISTSI